MSSLPKAAFIPAVRIERRMEEELAKAGLLPRNPERPVVDIEAFLDKHLGVKLDQHAALDPDVLGMTHFTPGRQTKVEINRDLTEAAEGESPEWVTGRWRITMAHEAGHVILHAADAEAASKQFSLFDADADEEPVHLQRCMKRDLHAVGGKLDPREIQANYAMAALLMPRELFRLRAERVLPSEAAFDPSSRAYWEAVRELAHAFQVSKEAVRIRIEKLGLECLVGQMDMNI